MTEDLDPFVGARTLCWCLVRVVVLSDPCVNLCPIMTKRAARQTTFRFRSWGGKRAGAGRKPKGARAGVSHHGRPAVASRWPLHVTARLRPEVGSLRRKLAYKVVRAALIAANGCEGFRLVHFSVQGNHLHLVIEANSRQHLSRGMQGLSVRVARGLNKLIGRTGAVFVDRYHVHVLRTPRQVRHALAYVLNNFRRHQRQQGLSVRRDWLDEYSSAAWFDGWRDVGAAERRLLSANDAPPVCPPGSWLLGVGWRRHGLLHRAEVPGGRAA
jgi:REP element-mobilizing transposase RayT